MHVVRFTSLVALAAGLVLSFACKKTPSNARVSCRDQKGEKNSSLIFLKWAECTDNQSRDIFCFPIKDIAGEYDCKCAVHGGPAQTDVKFTATESSIPIDAPNERAGFANVNCHWSMETK